LLAEDSLVNQKLAVGLLENRGHTVTVTNNGKEAVAAQESQPFDLVLMDVQMPDMDGIEATALIRRREQQTGAHVPIVAMTAHAMKGDRARCLAAGMDGYIAKPIRTKELFATIEGILSSSAEPKAAGGSAAPQDEVMDWSAALATVGGDHRLLGEIVDAFLQECPRLLEQVREAISKKDAATLRRAAHTLKASMRYFGAKGAFDHAGRLEVMGQRGKLKDAEKTLASLLSEIERLMPPLRRFVRGKHTGHSD
jgi:CheY-like chemotaxis protein